MPFSKWCMRCKQEFLYSGAEERLPLIRCCVACRRDIEAEAVLNGLTRDASDDVLVAAIRGIAATEMRIATHGYLARRAGHRKDVARHTRRMVLAPIDKEAILVRYGA